MGRNPTMEDMEDMMDDDGEEAWADFERTRADAREQMREERRRAAERERAEAQRRTRKEARREREPQTEAARAQTAAAKVKKTSRLDIAPIIMPTRQEYEATKRRLDYREGYIHFAVAGTSGSGKSSLINAFRGLNNGSDDPTVASTGVTETTERITRYPDPNEANPFVWYDIPGAGTLSVPDWKYFNNQGLYIFDAIIVLMDARFTAIDIAILQNCARFKIPSYIVRSKSLTHIENVSRDMRRTRHSEVHYEHARDKYMMETRKSVSTNLPKAGLPPQAVYMVDTETLLDITEGKVPKKDIDEIRLVEDILLEARNRRVDMALPLTVSL